MDGDTPKHQPRIRKTAPTIRERAEAEQSRAEKKSRPGRLKPVLSRAKTPFKKIRLPGTSKIPSPLRKIGRGIGKGLGWLAPRYFINAWREVRQVTWPSRHETRRLTGAVLIFAVVFGALVFGVDKVLDIIFKKVVLK